MATAAPPAGAAGAAAALAAAAQLPGLKRPQVERAVGSLIKFMGDQQANSAALFEEDDLIYVTVALKRSPHPAGPKKIKPIRLPVPHPLFTVDGSEICLFVKDDKTGAGHKAAKARLEKFTARGGVNKVVGTGKLRTKFESHEAKRKLCGSYDIFLADERVLPSLPKLIGKSFFKKKKTPIPIDIRAPSFPDAVKRAVEQSAFMPPPAGSCVTVRAARAGMGAAAAAENVLAVIAGVAARVPKKWANVQAVYIKSGDSVALPVFQTLPDKPARIGGGEGGGAAEAGAAAAMEDDSGSEGEEEEPAAPAKRPAAKAAKAGGKAVAAAAGGGKQRQAGQGQRQKAAGGGRRRGGG